MGEVEFNWGCRLPTLVDYIPWTQCHRTSNHVWTMATESIAAIFGKVLREQRNARGISQEALALSADVDRTFVSQMERGIRQPTLTTLCKLSEALDIQPSTLVARVEKLLR
jgi:ribosome-binding protein aMBF1 (putative translation factor)